MGSARTGSNPVGVVFYSCSSADLNHFCIVSVGTVPFRSYGENEDDKRSQAEEIIFKIAGFTCTFSDYMDFMCIHFSGSMVKQSRC